MSKIKKISKHKKKIFLFCALIVFSLFFIGLQARKYVFAQCVVHVDHSPTHTHTQLSIVQDGQKITIPSNIGITDTCMHPLHTHDTTGLIHMEYPYPFPFFLGDFFDVMGVKFDNNQIGALKSIDGYEITVFKNEKKIHGFYRFILLKDLDKIEIQIKKI